MSLLLILVIRYMVLWSVCTTFSFTYLVQLIALVDAEKPLKEVKMIVWLTPDILVKTKHYKQEPKLCSTHLKSSTAPISLVLCMLT